MSWLLAATWNVPPVQVFVNGEPREIPQAATIAVLLDQLAFSRRYLAVECNETLVPRAEHERHVLADGDRLEIVTLVGGG